MSPAELSQLDALRRVLENLSDEAIHTFADTVIRAILHGMADELADRVIDTLVAQLSATPPTRTVLPDTAKPQPPQPKTGHIHQDAVTRTCEVCGRTGTRRYVQTDTGWRCSPTATKCPGNQQCTCKAAPRTFCPAHGNPPEQDRPGESNKTSEISTPNVALPDRSSTPTPTQVATPPAYTARCQDCTRTFTLTGRVLQLAVEQHELKHAHIVDIVGDADE